MTEHHQRDAFISHASDDKEDFVRHLAKALTDEGVHVWYDEYDLRVGDSLSQSINRGLSESRFGIAVLSTAFFEKQWPQWELDGLVARQNAEGRKVILPVWHEVSRDDVLRYSPPLADRVAARSEDGIERVVEKLIQAMLEDPAVLGFAGRASNQTTPVPEPESPPRQMWAPAEGFRIDDEMTVDEHFGGQESGRKGPWMVAPAPIGVSMPARYWYPFEFPDLHRRFATLNSRLDETSPYSREILDFANKHGALGHTTSLVDPDPKSETYPAPPGGPSVVRGEKAPLQAVLWGESFEYWADEVRKLAALVGVWDLVQAEDRNALDILVEWTQKDSRTAVGLDVAVSAAGNLMPEVVSRVMASRPNGQLPSEIMRDTGTQYLSYELIAHSGVSPAHRQLLEKWQFGDPLEPARYWVHREVNKVMRAHVGPMILPFRNSQMTSVPDCLRGALYALFAQEISGKPLA